MTTGSAPRAERSSEALAAQSPQPRPLALRLQQIFVRLGVLPFLILIAVVVFSLL